MITVTVTCDRSGREGSASPFADPESGEPWNLPLGWAEITVRRLVPNTAELAAWREHRAETIPQIIAGAASLGTQITEEEAAAEYGDAYPPPPDRAVAEATHHLHPSHAAELVAWLAASGNLSAGNSNSKSGTGGTNGGT
jgi:hypothetical protein